MLLSLTGVISLEHRCNGDANFCATDGSGQLNSSTDEILSRASPVIKQNRLDGTHALAKTM